MSVFRALIFASLLVAFPFGGSAYAGRIQRNVRDGMQSASSFCHSVVGLSWSYSQAESGSSMKPTGSQFAKAANEIGGELADLYGKNAPKKFSSLFVQGWNQGMKKCQRSL